MRIEVRADQVVIDGYVNAVERESRVIPSPRGRFIERIQAGAFTRALQKAPNVDLLFNHKEERKLGSLSQGNLELFEDSVGLRAIATITDVEVIQKARNNELRGWSFSFQKPIDHWEDGEDGIQRRTLKDFELLEVSILDQTPAYIATSIEARGDEQTLTENRNLENRIVTNIIEERRQDTSQNQNTQADISLFEREIELLKMKGGHQ